MREMVVSAPGKLILMGEHAAVYQRPALVAAVDLRLRVRVRPGTEEGVTLDLPQLEYRDRFSWEAIRDYAREVRKSWSEYARRPSPEGFEKVRRHDPAHVVKVALGEAVAFLGEETGSPLILRIDSHLPMGSGFGSSAATAVAVLAAYLGCQGVTLTREELESLALEVERRQHGMPSGVDSATVLYGGILWAQSQPGLGVMKESVTVRSPLLSRLRVYDSGRPQEPTGAVVAAVRRRVEEEPERYGEILQRMEGATRRLRDLLAGDGEDPAAMVDLIRESEACLEELGVVPEATRRLVRSIEAQGGAAKISGAGSLAGPGAGSLLVYHPSPETIPGWGFLRPLPHYPVSLGAQGLREEAEG